MVGLRLLRRMVGCLGGVGESGVRLLSWAASMRVDSSAIAEDMSAIAAARRLVACKTRENESRSQGVRIVVAGSRSSFSGVVVVASVLGIIVNAVVVASSSLSSLMGMIVFIIIIASSSL